MGTGRNPGRWRAVALAGIASAAAAIAAVVAVSGGGDAPARRSGCETDADCGPARVCARGGCLPLTGGEELRFWRADLDAQKLRGAAWRPRAAYGEKVLPADVCPVKPGRVNLLEPGKVSLVHRLHVFELLGDTVRIHVQNQMRGALWLEGLRFSFPTVDRVDPGRVCGSATVAQVAMEKGRADVVDAALARTAPAGTIASAALSIEAPLPPADADGFREFSFPLDPAFGSGAIVSVLAVPLGSSVARLDGPTPGRQRLLTGFVAYYWEHGAARGAVSIALKAPPAPADLDVSELKP